MSADNHLHPQVIHPWTSRGQPPTFSPLGTDLEGCISPAAGCGSAELYRASLVSLQNSFSELPMNLQKPSDAGAQNQTCPLVWHPRRDTRLVSWCLAAKSSPLGVTVKSCCCHSSSQAHIDSVLGWLLA